MSSEAKAIVVAVDFGTTFSGVAWAQVAKPDTVYILNQWPDSPCGSIGGMTSEKVPSEVAFTYRESSTPKALWGFQIPENMPRLQWFKLNLVSDQKGYFQNSLSMCHEDSLRMSIPRHTTAEIVVTDYLGALRDHAMQFLRSQVGAVFDTMKFTYVITKTLAGDAGNHIISEAEAAAIHALKASNPHHLQVDDTIVLCDAGGGTVDVITCTIRVTLYELDTPQGQDVPLYFNRNMKEYAILNPQLDRILRKRIPVVEDADGKNWYQVDFQIHAKYCSAHFEYSLWFEGKNHGAVKVEYV